MYSKSLPEMADIIRLSKLVHAYPATRSEIVRMGRRWNVSENLIEFVRQFPVTELFETRALFVARCEELALRIRQDWQTPKVIVQTKLL